MATDRADGGAGTALLMELRFLEGRYHGLGARERAEWPPSPFRLFSALVAGAYGGRHVAEPRAAKDAAFRWLERLAPPVIATPPSIEQAPVTIFVPHNDIDSVDGDPARIGEIRGGRKLFRPRLFDPDQPLLYLWTCDGDAPEAATIEAMAARVHTVGRGIDMAFARAEILPVAEAEARLVAHGGPITRPLAAGGGEEVDLLCPTGGSFDSLVTRHAETTRLYTRRKAGRSKVTAFTKAWLPASRAVSYGSAERVLLYDLRRTPGSLERLAHSEAGGGRPLNDVFTLPTWRAVELAERIRDRLATRLAAVYPERAGEIERVLVGRGAGPRDKDRRPAFLPIPSIGHDYAHHGLRRFALRVPPDCPIPMEDLSWGLRGLDLSDYDPETGELRDDGIGDWPTLVPVGDPEKRLSGGWSMLDHYIGTPAKRWRSVTPVALPSSTGGGRATGGDRLRRAADGVAAVAAALRHAGHDPAGAAIRIRREPFHRAGTRAERFAHGRFLAERLTHVDIVFPHAIRGPLVIGDGRYLGLGLCAPVRLAPEIQAFALDRPPATGDRAAVADAFRRAVMAAVGDHLGRKADDLPLFYSGHDEHKEPSRAVPHRHVFIALDPGPPARVLVITPERVDRRPAGEPVDHGDARETLDAALDRLSELYAGRAGAYRLRRLAEPGEGDPLIGPAVRFVSATPYRPTRYPGKRDDPAAFVAADAAAACRSFGLPTPRVEVLALDRGPRGSLAARLALTFAQHVEGPILIGRDAHTGGGLFQVG